MVSLSTLTRSVDLKARGRHASWSDMDSLRVAAQLLLQEFNQEKNRTLQLRQTSPLKRPRTDFFVDAEEERGPPDPQKRLRVVHSVVPNEGTKHSSNNTKASKPRVREPLSAPRVAPDPLPAPQAVPETLPAPRVVPKPLPAPQALPETLPAPRVVPDPLPAPRAVPAPLPAPRVLEPPEPIKSAIVGMGGTEVALVIEKSLKDTDIRRAQNRLSVPIRQVVNPGFLTAEEATTLSSRDQNHKPVGMDVAMVEPDGFFRTNITLKRWDMYKDVDKTGRRKCNSLYVLNNTWFEIVDRHRLKAETFVQLWSFRSNSDLCFALAVIP